MDKKNLKKYLDTMTENSISEFKIGKIYTNFIDTNLSKQQFYKVLDSFNTIEKKYKTYSSWKYFNYTLNLYENNREYYYIDNIIWKDILSNNNIDIIAIQYDKRIIEPIEFPSTKQYHNNENIEEMMISIKNNIKLYFQIKDNSNYQIYIKFQNKKIMIEQLTDLLELINNITFILDSNKYLNNDSYMI